MSSITLLLLTLTHISVISQSARNSKLTQKSWGLTVTYEISVLGEIKFPSRCLSGENGKH